MYVRVYVCMYLGSHAFEKVTARFQVTQLEVTVTRDMEVTVTRDT